MSENNDTVERVCRVLDVDKNDIITFEDFISKEYKKPYSEIKHLPEIKMLRKAWNISCESLINVLDGIQTIVKRMEQLKEKE